MSIVPPSTATEYELYHIPRHVRSAVPGFTLRDLISDDPDDLRRLREHLAPPPVPDDDEPTDPFAELDYNDEDDCSKAFALETNRLWWIEEHGGARTEAMRAAIWLITTRFDRDPNGIDGLAASDPEDHRLEPRAEMIARAEADGISKRAIFRAAMDPRGVFYGHILTTSVSGKGRGRHTAWYWGHDPEKLKKRDRRLREEQVRDNYARITEADREWHRAFMARGILGRKANRRSE